MELIYSGANNKLFSDIALKYNFKLGARLPTTVYYDDLYFADQNWHQPNKFKYIKSIKKHNPYKATVKDIETKNDLCTALDWSRAIAKYVHEIIIIPKVTGIIKHLPRQINNTQVILGYSIPSSYGSTNVPIWEFKGWDIHLLGGGPGKQIELFMYLDNIGNVISLDINSISKAAMFGSWWDNGWHNNNTDKDKDFIYRLFEKSCIGIMKAWENIL